MSICRAGQAGRQGEGPFPAVAAGCDAHCANLIDAADACAEERPAFLGYRVHPAALCLRLALPACGQEVGSRCGMSQFASQGNGLGG